MWPAAWQQLVVYQQALRSCAAPESDKLLPNVYTLLEGFGELRGLTNIQSQEILSARALRP